MTRTRLSHVFVALATFLSASTGCFEEQAPAGETTEAADAAEAAEVPTATDWATATYVPADTDEEIWSVVDDVWGVVAGAQCWELTENYMQQYQFYGNYQFRYNGFEQWAGTLGLYGAGTYGDLPTVLISTWTEDLEVLAVIDPQTIAHGYWTAGGSLFVQVYVASTRCL